MFDLEEYYEHKKAFGGDPKKARPYYGNKLYVAQPKIDGVRYHLYIERTGHARIYSRATSAVTGLPVDKTDVLQHLADDASAFLPPGCVLDGEVIFDSSRRTTFKDVTRITGATPQNALSRQQRMGFLRFCAFDVIAWEGRDITAVPLRERLTFLPNCHGKYIFPVETAVTEEEKLALRDRIVEEGGEGLILKNLDSIYNPKRNKDWIKDKFVVHIDVVFMGVTDAKAMSVKKGDSVASPTRIAGLAGAIRFGQFFPVSGEELMQAMENGPVQFFVDRAGQRYLLRQIGQTSGFDDEMRMDVTLNANLYTDQMRVFTVRSQMQYSDSFALREPRFETWRDDKDPKECLYDPEQR